MKKLFVTLAVICLLAGTAAAESMDYTAMTNEELHQIINLARNELTRRELAAGSKILLFEQDGVSLYLTGGYEIQEWGTGKHVLKLEGIVINDSDQMIDVRIDTVTVNGWEVYGGIIQKVDAGKKKKDTFEIRLYDGDIHSYEEIEDIEFNFRVTASADYKKLFTVENVTVYFNQK